MFANDPIRAWYKDINPAAGVDDWSTRRRYHAITPDTPEMVEIPVIVTPPDCNPLTNSPDNEEQAPHLHQEPDFSPAIHEVKQITTSTVLRPVNATDTMVSEGTQTESPKQTPGQEVSPARAFSPGYPLSPVRSHSESSGPKPHFPPWRELRHHIYNPHPTHPGALYNEGKVEGHLSPPSPPPKCPMTPQADLYDGQSPSNFGMQFDRPTIPHWRRNIKPATCAQNYEDHKHRMLMEWLNRRNSV
ncbi:hypothetical protein AYO20_07307 [Fonsecaea nubica]|uniref:Uncharacterized protein n=1 Tax=Fonsecaea nubica TaxID=856822 RepID=A0A178CWZ6_9EURO|nr:hypothetical protein AYO20_07307 [Fonsecaea nubica]OAL33451.1 hypothetical protein AYO20_07307 [Fonsecaea nubica]